MILFTFPGFETLSQEIEKIPKVRVGAFRRDRFADGEMRVCLCDADVAGSHCAVLGTLAAPEENMVAFAMACHTLKKEGARKVTAILPYLAYARADKEKSKESLGAAFVGGMLRAAGVDEVITADIHSEIAAHLLGVPTVSLDVSTLFASALAEMGVSGATVVAPDEGARERARKCIEALGLKGEEPYVFVKERIGGEITLRAPEGKVHDTAIIVDDIIDTGKTISAASRLLAQKGVQRIFVVATHGVFSPKCQLELGNTPVDRFIVTDSIAPTIFMGNRTSRVSVGPLFAQYLKKEVS